MSRAAFYASVRATLFSGKLSQSQVDGMERILDECEARGLNDKAQVAYVLATAYHETGRTMLPIKEWGGKLYLRLKKYWPFFGRGYVQLTWKSNYEDWSKRLGVDLVANPDLALDPAHAARILVEGMIKGTFTGKKLGHYIGLKKRDFVGARRIINGVDKASMIAGYAEKFLKAIS